MSKRHKFYVTVSRKLEVTFNASIMPDDEWRKHFYGSITSPRALAEHFAYNAAVNGITELSRLDGFADKPNRMLTIREIDGWDSKATER